MVEKNYKKVIILEDDAKFAIYFKSTLRHLINSLDSKDVKWDML